jgi:hypothetical protein
MCLCENQLDWTPCSSQPSRLARVVLLETLLQVFRDPDLEATASAPQHVHEPGLAATPALRRSAPQGHSSLLQQTGGVPEGSWSNRPSPEYGLP